MAQVKQQTKQSNKNQWRREMKKSINRNELPTGPKPEPPPPIEKPVEYPKDSMFSYCNLFMEMDKIKATFRENNYWIVVNSRPGPIGGIRWNAEERKLSFRKKNDTEVMGLTYMLNESKEDFRYKFNEVLGLRWCVGEVRKLTIEIMLQLYVLILAKGDTFK